MRGNTSEQSRIWTEKYSLRFSVWAAQGIPMPIIRKEVLRVFSFRNLTIPSESKLDLSSNAAPTNKSTSHIIMHTGGTL
jgi:hypothetical protein